MKTIITPCVLSNSFKKAGAIFLVFILILIEIPDTLWWQLHTHKHHNCGLSNVVHEYTPDCILDQRFLQPWYYLVTPWLEWLSNPYYILIQSNYNHSITSSLLIIHHNKSPPIMKA